MTLHRHANTNVSGVAHPFRQWADPEQLRRVVDDRVDIGEYLIARAVPERVTLPARIVVISVWLVCLIYCIALWTGAVEAVRAVLS